MCRAFRTLVRSAYEVARCHHAVETASRMGIELLSEEECRALQLLGECDRKTSSWGQTLSSIRALGGALFCEGRYDTVFVYHNGADLCSQGAEKAPRVSEAVTSRAKVWSKPVETRRAARASGASRALRRGALLTGGAPVPSRRASGRSVRPSPVDRGFAVRR